MLTDSRGHALSTQSSEAAQALDKGLSAYLTWRTDTINYVKQALEADPDFALAHCLKGLFIGSMKNAALLPAMQASLNAASTTIEDATKREQGYYHALKALLDGNIFTTATQLELLLIDHPKDLVAMRLAQLDLFWSGEVHWMCRISERSAPHCPSDMVDFGAYQAIRAFSLEETGQFELAEKCGRDAVERSPGDPWGAHAVAHVLEMQGRDAEGIAWLEGLCANWDDKNHIVHHLWWHLCLYYMEQGAHEKILELYDSQVRNPNSPRVKAMADFNVDMQNCAALLRRLEIRGVEVGHRWEDVADVAAARIGDHTSPFTTPHYLMILAAAGREAKAQDMLAAARHFAFTDKSHLAARYRSATLPACEAALAFQKKDFAGVIAHLAPNRHLLWQMGGSHAQRDLFFQMLAYAAHREGEARLVALLIKEIGDLGIAKPQSRSGYSQLAA